jgi:serine/threonine-protein kinase
VTGAGGALAERARALVLGKYQPVARLATGGMAEILLARRRAAGGFEKLVVLKRLLPHLAEQRHLVEMFLDEARIAASISHPNVCQVFELDEEDARYVIVMEYLEGVTFGRVEKALPMRRGPRDLALLVELARQACEGLHHAHDLVGRDGKPVGLVHRDMSPSNLMVSASGTLKVLDFGIAKTRLSSVHTKTGLIKGKTGYMSPEQVRSRPLDRRSDVFSLAVVLHEAVTGTSLFRRVNEFETYRAILDERAPDVRELQPAAPAALAEALAAALHREPGARPATARDFALRLAAAGEALGPPLAPAEIAAWMDTQFGQDLAERRRKIAGALEAMGEGEQEGPTEVQELPTVPTDGEHDAVVMESLTTATAQQAPAAEPEPEPEPAAEPEPEPEPEPDRSRVLIFVSLASIAAAIVIVVAVLVWPRSELTPPAAAPVAAPAAVAAAEPAAPDARVAEPEPEITIESPDASIEAPIIEAPPVVAAPRPAAPAPRPPRPGFFTVDSRPYATIYVDGKKVGVTPLLRHALPPGTHAVRAVSETGAEQRFRVTIEAGREAPRKRLVW